MTKTLLAFLLAAPLAAPATPITLDDALALAARQSRDLTIAQADARIAGADGLAGWQGVLPRLDLSANGGRKFIGESSFSRVDPTTGIVIPPSPATDYPSYSASVTLTQPLFDWGAFRRLKQSSAGERAASRTWDESKLSVAFDVTRRFYEVVKAERSLAVLEKSAQRSAELVERADALYGAGRAQKSDTYNARVNLGNDRILVEQARSRLVQARSDLALTLGLPGDDAVQVVAPAQLEGPGLPGGEPPPLASLLARAREQRPALAAAEAQVEAAEAAASAARAGYLPTLSAQASYARNASNLTGAGGVVDSVNKDYIASVGVIFGWNLFAGRSSEAGLARAEASADRTRASAGKTADGVAREVTNARQAVVAQATQVSLSADNLSAADQGLKLARQRLDAGMASQLEVRDASLKFTQAELSLVQARIDHAVATADLARAVGGAL
jgi:outer membrane protein TolC